jgi:hypothetical protein
LVKSYETSSFASIQVLQYSRTKSQSLFLLEMPETGIHCPPLGGSLLASGHCFWLGNSQNSPDVRPSAVITAHSHLCAFFFWLGNFQNPLHLTLCRSALHRHHSSWSLTSVLAPQVGAATATGRVIFGLFSLVLVVLVYGLTSSCALPPARLRTAQQDPGAQVGPYMLASTCAGGCRALVSGPHNVSFFL